MKCKSCHIPFVDTRKYAGGEKKIFCSKLCGTRYNAKKSYAKNRDNPEFKKKSYARLKLWIKDNQERHNEYMRNYMNNVVGQKYYLKHKKKNLVNRRIQNNISYHKNKHKHLERNRNYQRLYRARKKLETQNGKK